MPDRSRVSQMTAPGADAVLRAAPHPRIRERRIEVRRDEGRRRLRVILVGLATFGSATAVFALTRSPLLDVDRVELQGAHITSVDEVAVAAGLADRPPLVDVDLERVEAAVEALPWVDTATASRKFPNRVHVQVRERVPLAVVAEGESAALVDPSGRVLGSPEAVPADLIRIEQSGAVPPAGAEVGPPTKGALALVDMLPPLLSTRVTAVRVDREGHLEADLDGRIPVRLGAPEQLTDKVVALATLVERVDLRRVDTIDVRVPGSPVLTRG